MGSTFLLLKSPVLLYWMYNGIHFSLLGGGICCIPLKNVVFCSSLYLFRQSLILLSLLLNFVRPGPEQSLAQSSFTPTVTRHLLRTAWPPVYCEVFRSQEPSVSSGLLPTVLWRLSPTPRGSRCSYTHRLQSLFRLWSFSRGSPSSLGLCPTK